MPLYEHLIAVTKYLILTKQLAELVFHYTLVACHYTLACHARQ